MKKFGTPTGAGPGSASEKVGLASVGVPSGLRSGSDGVSCSSDLSLSFFDPLDDFFSASTGG